MDLDTIVGLLTTVSTVGFGTLYIRQRLRENELEEHANIDELTQVYTRRFFNTAIPRMLAVARRYDEDAALISIDLDKLKPVNDRYGHRMGDEVLKAFAKAAMLSIREGDIVARYGGDEFLVYLNRTDGEGSGLVVARLEEKFKEESGKAFLRHNVNPVNFATLGVSCGIANAKEADYNFARLVQLADERMYKIKNSK